MSTAGLENILNGISKKKLAKAMKKMGGNQMETALKELTGKKDEEINVNDINDPALRRSILKSRIRNNIETKRKSRAKNIQEKDTLSSDEDGDNNNESQNISKKSNSVNSNAKNRKKMQKLKKKLGDISLEKYMESVDKIKNNDYENQEEKNRLNNIIDLYTYKNLREKNLDQGQNPGDTDNLTMKTLNLSDDEDEDEDDDNDDNEDSDDKVE